MTRKPADFFVEFECMTQPDEFDGPAPFVGSASFATYAEARTAIECLDAGHVIRSAKLVQSSRDGTKQKVEVFHAVTMPGQPAWALAQDDFAESIFDRPL